MSEFPLCGISTFYLILHVRVGATDETDWWWLVDWLIVLFLTYKSVLFAFRHMSNDCALVCWQYSLCNESLIELSNSGASGSLFYLSSDDEYIIKTVQHKEAEFLQKLLPGYFMVRFDEKLYGQDCTYRVNVDMTIPHNKTMDWPLISTLLSFYPSNATSWIPQVLLQCWWWQLGQ